MPHGWRRPDALAAMSWREILVVLGIVLALVLVAALAQMLFG
jgi:hypothetical protein